MTATYREFRTATREFELTDGKHCFAYGEVRYEFTVKPRRPASTWANASEGFTPAERPFVSLKAIEVKQGRYGKWMPADGLLADYLGDVPDAWFLEQIEEQEA